MRWNKELKQDRLGRQTYRKLMRQGIQSVGRLLLTSAGEVGIPARYKIFSTMMIDAWREATIDADPLVQKWYDSLGYFLLEGEGEAYVDGEWQVAHVGPTSERQAAAGIPLSRLGEDAIGSWFVARPGSTMWLESPPRGLVIGSRILYLLSPGSMERINVSVQEQIAEGGRVIAGAGGREAYDRQVRRQAEPVLIPS